MFNNLFITSNKEVIKHILIYKTDNNSTDINYVIDQTNAILKQTLKGSLPNSYVIIEDSFPIEMYNGSYRDRTHYTFQ